MARSRKGKEKIEEEDSLWCEHGKCQEKNEEVDTQQNQVGLLHQSTSSSPTPSRKEKIRSLREIYEVTKPPEALFVDLHEYNSNNFEEYQIGNLHPTIEEALANREALEWKESMHKEIDALEQNGTKGITRKWMLTKKCDANGQVTRLKALLVARGFRQVHGVDYNETFAPTIKMVAIQLLFSISVGINLELHHLDLEIAFLHGDLMKKST